MSDQPPPNFAQYPRPQISYGSQYLRQPGIYFEAIGDAWKIISSDLGAWVLFTLVALIVATAISLPLTLAGLMFQNGGSLIPSATAANDLGAQLQRQVLGLPFGILNNGLQFTVYGGVFFAALKRVRGEPLAIEGIFAGFKAVVPLAVCGVLLWLGVALGMVFLIIPGLYFGAASIFAPLLIIDKGMSPVDAMMASWKTLGSSTWMMILLVIVAYIASIVGFFACCVGLLVTWPIFFVTIALHYHYYFDQPMDQGFVPAPMEGPRV
ncbi:hypothetical protein BH11ARM1_BH11ARM1_13430 [soil metagenome]